MIEACEVLMSNPIFDDPWPLSLRHRNQQVHSGELLCLAGHSRQANSDPWEQLARGKGPPRLYSAYSWLQLESDMLRPHSQSLVIRARPYPRTGRRVWPEADSQPESHRLG